MRLPDPFTPNLKVKNQSFSRIFCTIFMMTHLARFEFFSEETYCSLNIYSDAQKKFRQIIANFRKFREN